MQNALDLIANADDNQLQTLFAALYNRYQIVRPELELSVFFLDKRDDPNDQIDRAITLLNNMKTSSK